MMATSTSQHQPSPTNNTSSSQEQTFKILLIGDSGTGKSSLLLRFSDDTFLEEEMSATIGVDFKVHHLALPPHFESILNSPRMKLSLWDTAGQERFRTLTSSYYRGAQGVILVYDLTRRDTFEHLRDVWLPELECYSSNVIKMIIGNKMDKPREVERDEGLAFAKENGALFLECSAKTKVGVQQAFEELCFKVLETPELWKKKEGDGKVNLGKNDEESYGSCTC